MINEVCYPIGTYNNDSRKRNAIMRTTEAHTFYNCNFSVARPSSVVEEFNALKMRPIKKLQNWWTMTACSFQRLSTFYKSLLIFSKSHCCVFFLFFAFFYEFSFKLFKLKRVFINHTPHFHSWTCNYKMKLAVISAVTCSTASGNYWVSSAEVLENSCSCCCHCVCV